MNKQTEDKILEMLLHIHEKSIWAHPLGPKLDGVQWWIKCCSVSRLMRLHISCIGIDAYSAKEFWLKYWHDFRAIICFASFSSRSILHFMGVLISSPEQRVALRMLGGQVCSVFVLT